MARLPYISKEQLAPSRQEIYDQIQQKRGYLPRPFAVLLNQPPAAARVAALGEYVRFDSWLDPVVRETTILATAREMNNQYQWTHHEPLARQAGVRDEVIDAIRERRGPKGLLPKEGVFIQYAQEMVRNGQVREATFQAVLHLLGREGTVDLTVTVAYYTMLAQVMAALEVELEEGMTPLLPE